MQQAMIAGAGAGLGAATGVVVTHEDAKRKEENGGMGDDHELSRASIIGACTVGGAIGTLLAWRDTPKKP